MRLAGLLARLGLRRGARDKALDDALQQRLQEMSASLVSQRDAVECASRNSAEQQQRVLDELHEHLEALRLEDVRKALRAIDRALRRERRHNKAFQEHRRTIRQGVGSGITEQLASIAASPRPIVVGPWTADSALEVLYWAPFVRWFSRQFAVPPERLHVVSRGGAPWYADIAADYADLRSLSSAADLTAGMAAADSQQDTITEKTASGLTYPERDHATLHPSLMFTLFEPFWRDDAPVQLVERFTVPRRLPPPPLDLPDLPAQFIATRFAFSSSFPDTSEHRVWLDQLLGSLTQSGDIVWLGEGIAGADGEGQTLYTPPPHDRLHRIDHLNPQRAVETHAAIIARSTAYVGTYGALAYVASYYRVPSVTFYAVRNFFPHYRRVADHALGVDTNAAPLVLHVTDAALLRTMLGFSTGA